MKIPWCIQVMARASDTMTNSTSAASPPRSYNIVTIILGFTLHYHWLCIVVLRVFQTQLLLLKISTGKKPKQQSLRVNLFNNGLCVIALEV